jgi:uncharacterized protein
MAALSARNSGALRALVEFCRFVRANGLSSGTKETIDCLEVLTSANLVDSDGLKFALRAVLCSSKEEWDLFDGLFETFWGGYESNQVRPSTKRGSSKVYGDSGQTEGNGTWVLAGNGADSELKPEGEGKAVSGASIAERLKAMDFAEMPQDDLAALDRLSQRLLRRMSCRVSRQLRPRSRGLVNLRKTIRLSIGRGGDPIELSRKGRRLQRARLVILLDVSDSMSLYSFFLLKFVYALAKQFREVDAFVFSTSLVKITDVLSARRLSDALETLSHTAAGWSGGTKIGESLEDFNRRHAERLLSRSGTVFMILSDGWDTGEPGVLATELHAIKRRVGKLIWLNPLLGLDGYEPITRGMSAALPHIGVFAPAHNLASLLELERHLGPRRRG